MLGFVVHDASARKQCSLGYHEVARDRKTEEELLIPHPILIPHLEPGGCPLNSFCSEPSSCSSVIVAQYLSLTFIQSLS
ncbi:Spectrin Beta Chain, Erythrocytic [Manis pentadactyla]|nr:Spectrin Beta Chain, Erythrocytic [Manis pentadactyla]